MSGFRWGERDDEKSSHLVLWDSFSSLAAKLAQLVRVASVQAAVKPRHHTAAPAVILSHLSQAFDSLLCLLSWATCTCLCWMITASVRACVFARVCGGELEREMFPSNQSPLRQRGARVSFSELQLPKLRCEKSFRSSGKIYQVSLKLAIANSFISKHLKNQTFTQCKGKDLRIDGCWGWVKSRKGAPSAGVCMCWFGNTITKPQPKKQHRNLTAIVLC